MVCVQIDKLVQEASDPPSSRRLGAITEYVEMPGVLLTLLPYILVTANLDTDTGALETFAPWQAINWMGKLGNQ